MRASNQVPNSPEAQIETRVLRDPQGFANVWPDLQTLRRELKVQDDVLLDPLHFLTAIDPSRRSCSVACFRQGTLLGVVYATEQMVHNRSIGYAVGGDFAGRGLILCRPADEAAVLEASIQQLLREGLHSLHLRLMSVASGHTIFPGTRVQYLDATIPGDRLPLRETFEEFLGTLGKHTRRNIRNYIRKTQAENIAFVADLAPAEYQATFRILNAETDFPAKPTRLEHDERLMTLHGGGFRFGLRAADGALVSVLCGFRRGDRFHLLTQLNRGSLAHLSLSMVLRGYVIEHLIAQGCREMQFMGGSSLILGRFCIPQDYRSIFIDKSNGLVAVGKRMANMALEMMAKHGKPIPDPLKTICNGFLSHDRLVERTALSPAAIVFGHSPHQAPAAQPAITADA